MTAGQLALTLAVWPLASAALLLLKWAGRHAHIHNHIHTRKAQHHDPRSGTPRRRPAPTRPG